MRGAGPYAAGNCALTKRRNMYMKRETYISVTCASYNWGETQLLNTKKMGFSGSPQNMITLHYFARLPLSLCSLLPFTASSPLSSSPFFPAVLSPLFRSDRTSALPRTFFAGKHYGQPSDIFLASSKILYLVTMG